MTFVEDLGVFINDDTPGYLKLEIDGTEVEGIYQNDFQSDGFVQSSDPQFVVKTADISGVSGGANVENVSTGEQWSIIEFEPDGSGVTRLQLRLK